MPLIVITGYPCSHKTRRVKELKQYFDAEGKEVYIVDESDEIRKAGFAKNVYYNDSRKEKHVRDVLKSQVQRLISPRNVVIYDGSNYIKGYRYELYCITKANHSTQCTLYTITSNEDAWRVNECKAEDEKYTKDTFDALLMRFEEPDGKNRWDAPLFITSSDSQLELDAIFTALFHTTPPPPNQSTQNAPLSAPNFLYDMNKIVKEITSCLVSHTSKGCRSTVAIPMCKHVEINLRNATVPKLLSLSRQFLNYSKLNTPELVNVPNLYAQYLQTNLGT